MRRLALLGGALFLLAVLAVGLTWSRQPALPLSRPAAATAARPAPSPAQPAAVAPAASPAQPAAVAPASELTCPAPPERDLYELTQRLRLRAAQPIPRVVNADSPDYQVGDQRTFSLTNMETYVHYTATATLRYRTAHAYFYVEDGVEVPLADLQRSGDEFENRIYPEDRRYFGSEWTPGIDNDPRLTILNARIPGVAGYYSVADEYPTLVNPFSNQREMIYVNLGAVRLGTDSYHAVLAHEFVHAIHWNRHKNEEAWVNEGMAELGSRLLGYRSGLDRMFMARPDTQLTAWTDDLRATPPHYGAALLFADYFATRFGGYTALPDIIAQKDDGPAGLENYLAGLGAGVSFDDVFRDWVVANYLDLADGGLYSYPNVEVRIDALEKLTEYGQRRNTVFPYAADYVALDLTGDARLRFAGQANARLLPAAPHGGRFAWWGNRGDGVDSTLTRELDLTTVERATLNFWLWYDIEENWDYAYVTVSDDGGATWTIIPGRHSRTDNPLGSSFGPGYTGKSGGGKEAAWVEESIDLSPYAGKQILLRFEYVTDEGVNNHGLAIDDLAIAELGFQDDAESDAGWAANGFLRTDNSLPGRFFVRIVRRGGTPLVEDVPLDDQQQGQAELRNLGANGERTVLVVGSTTPCTTLPGEYTLAVESLP